MDRKLVVGRLLQGTTPEDTWICCLYFRVHLNTYVLYFFTLRIILFPCLYFFALPPFNLLWLPPETFLQLISTAPLSRQMYKYSQQLTSRLGWPVFRAEKRRKQGPSSMTNQLPVLLPAALEPCLSKHKHEAKNSAAFLQYTPMGEEANQETPLYNPKSSSFKVLKPTCEPQEDGPLKEKYDSSYIQELPDILKQSNHNT